MDLIRKVITDLCHLSPRQGENEVKTAEYLEDYLDERKIPFSSQFFKTEVPIITHAGLFLDGQKIPCLGNSFVGGKIISKSQIDFSLSSDYIETITYRDIPTITISRANAKLLEKSTHIEGDLVVKNFSYRSRNVLVGNQINPQKIIFAHFDCLGGGAIDNAGSVAVCLSLLTDSKDLLSENLFVLAGNEELSCDPGDYWGKGYREFEKINFELLRNAKSIIVVDGIGVSAPEVLTEDLDDAFPIKNLSEFTSKIIWLSSIQSEVLKCYHCLEDTVEKLNFDYLEQSASLLKQKLLNSV